MKYKILGVGMAGFGLFLFVGGGLLAGRLYSAMIGAVNIGLGYLIFKTES